jgi:hypothetical protein
LLGCHGCIFHGTRNSAQVCQNFGIGGVEPPKPPSVRHWFLVAFVLVVQCELCLTFTYRSPRMLLGYGDEEFPLFTAESELARSEAKTTINKLTEFPSEMFLVAFVLVVRRELCLTFTYRSPRMLLGYGDEEFPLFTAESEPIIWTRLFKSSCEE